MAAKDEILLHAVGDGAVGKTTLLTTYYRRGGDGVPTIFQDYYTKVTVDGKSFRVGLRDVYGGEDYERLRPLGYPGVDLFLICFSLSNPHSFASITTKWLRELTHFCAPEVPPFMIVGLKQDLRNDKRTHELISAKGLKMVTPEEGIALARKLRAVAYCECSSLAFRGLDTIFETAVRIAARNQREKRDKEKGKNKNKDKEKEREKEQEKAANKDKENDKKGVTHMLLKGLKNMTHRKGTGNACMRYSPLAPTSAVYGHTSVQIGTNTYLVGGCDAKGNFYRSLRYYSISTSKWNIIEELSDLPHLQFHTCVAQDENLYIFGGKSNGYRNEIYRINVETKKWERLQPKGLAPSPRYGHSAVLFGGKMYVFGGYDNSSFICNDLFSYSIEGNEWEKVQVQGAIPTSRFLHNAVVHDQIMYIFGGLGDKNALYNDIYQFEFGHCTWTKVKTKGQSPNPRYGCSAAAMPGGMYIFGGYDKPKDKVYSNLFLFEFLSKEWFSVPIACDAKDLSVEEKGNGKEKEIGEEKEKKLEEVKEQNKEEKKEEKKEKKTEEKKEDKKEEKKEEKNEEKKEEKKEEKQEKQEEKKGEEDEKGDKREQNIAEIGPSPRFNHACVWSPQNSSLIISGGRDSENILASVFKLIYIKPLVDALPQHIIIHIISFLPLHSFFVMQSVCKQLHIACNSKEIWEHLCKRLLYQFDEKVLEKQKKTHKQFFKDNYMIVSVPEWE